MRRLVMMLLFAIAGIEPAAAERLVVSLSNDRVAVTSSFVGENLVLFGVVQSDEGRAAPRADYDLAVTVTGPRETLRTRRKQRVLGIWVNVDSREFVRVPSYLAVLSNRPARTIASPEVLRRLQVGLDNFLLTQRIGPDIADTVPNDPFRVAFVRQQSQMGLYRQSADAVTFLTPSVFRVSIPLPANAPTGIYPIDISLFAGGERVGHTVSSLRVIKTGIEQYVADAAHDYGLLYGIGTALMAVFIGWFGSVVFRRD